MKLKLLEQRKCKTHVINLDSYLNGPSGVQQACEFYR